MSDIAEAGSRRRARGGGGAARRAERSAVSFKSARFIERNIPTMDILSEEALEIIERNAETVLEEVGIAFTDNPEGLELWRQAGADVQDERVQIPVASPGNSVLPRPQNSSSMPETRNGALKSAAIPPFSPRFTARPSCAMPKAAVVMRRWRISRNS